MGPDGIGPPKNGSRIAACEGRFSTVAVLWQYNGIDFQHYGTATVLPRYSHGTGMVLPLYSVCCDNRGSLADRTSFRLLVVWPQNGILSLGCRYLTESESPPHGKVHTLHAAVNVVHRADDIDILGNIETFMENIVRIYQILVLCHHLTQLSTIAGVDREEGACHVARPFTL